MSNEKFTTRLKGHDNAFKELFFRHPANPILLAENWPYPVHTVFNPAATLFQGKILLLARVEDRRGFSHLTKAISENGIDGWKIDTVPTLEPNSHEYPEEVFGIEDPRICRLEEIGKWAITYTAFSQGGPLVAMALTDDFETFERMGPIMPREDKDAALFPRRINGKWVLIHRPIVDSYVPGSHIWLSYSQDLIHWSNQHVLMHARSGAWWDSGKIGLSAPPLETPEGWLLLYHGVRQTASGSLYRLGLALLDLNDPSKVLHRSDEWIFGPQTQYEKVGDVADVVFSCGWVLDEQSGVLKMYYGGADTCIALATTTINDLLGYIRQCPEPRNGDFY